MLYDKAGDGWQGRTDIVSQHGNTSQRSLDPFNGLFDPMFAHDDQFTPTFALRQRVAQAC